MILNLLGVLLCVAGIAIVAGIAGGWTFSIMEALERRQQRSITVTTSIDGKKLLAIECDQCKKTTQLSRVYVKMKEWRDKNAP